MNNPPNHQPSGDKVSDAIQRISAHVSKVSHSSGFIELRAEQTSSRLTLHISSFVGGRTDRYPTVGDEVIVSMKDQLPIAARPTENPR